MSESDVSEPSRTQVSMAERLAVVETKIGALKEDTGTIRNNLHTLNNEMQKLVLADQACAVGLAAIRTETVHLPDISTKLARFDELRPALEAIIQREQERKGAWTSWTVAGAAIVGAVAIVSGLILSVVALIRGAGHG